MAYNIQKWTLMTDHGGFVHRVDMNKVTYIKILQDDDHLYVFDNGERVNFKIEIEEKIGLKQ